LTFFSKTDNIYGVSEVPRKPSGESAMEKYCSECNGGPFNGDRGLSMHMSRMHKDDSAIVVKQPRNKDRMIVYIKKVLQKKPEGMNAKEILAGVKHLGFHTKARPSVAGTVIGGIISRHDEAGIRCDDNGIFRLYDNDISPVSTSLKNQPRPFNEVDFVRVSCERDRLLKQTIVLSDMLMGVAQTLGQVAVNLRD
jgi:hypothetical protein